MKLKMSKSKEKIGVRNPTDDDFSVTYDINNNGKPVTFTVPSHTIEYFEPIIAEHIIKHLAQKIVFSRAIKTNYEDEFEETKKGLVVDLWSSKI